MLLCFHVCTLAKTINHTSTAISLLNQEQHQLCNAILDNHVVLDYLMLCNHIGYESFNLCCFSLCDNSHTVNNQLTQLKQLANNIQQILPGGTAYGHGCPTLDGFALY